jgi:glycosyltransferase involved in cell wall biosynthesis
MAELSPSLRFRVMLYVDDPGVGGNAAYAQGLACGLADAGFAVTCVQSPNGGPHLGGAAADWRDPEPFAKISLPYDSIGSFFHAALDRRTPAEIFSREQPDVVIFSDSVPQSTAAAKPAAAALGVPVIAVKHLVLPDNAWARTASTRRLVEQSMAACDMTLTVSTENARTLQSLFTLDPARLRAVYNSAPAQFFRPPDDEARRRLRAEWGATDDDLVVFTAGRLIAQKGYDLQVRTIERLARAGQLDRLLFVWAGEAAADYQAMLLAGLDACGARHRVRLLGRRQDVDRCLDAADAFFLPSRGEGMPLSVIEAMAKGTPPLASAVSGIPEAIGEAGVLLPDPNRDPDGLAAQAAATLADWRDDPARRREIGRQAAARAARLFQPARQLRDMVDLIGEVSAGRGEYVSPGLALIRPDRRFPFLDRFDMAGLGGAADRSGGRHVRLLDGRAPYTLLPNRDEAQLIYNNALGLAGGRALVAGAGRGWTAVHIAAAGMAIDLLDPALAEDDLRADVGQALDWPERSTPSVQLSVAAPGDGVPALAAAGAPWRLLYVDGDSPAVDAGATLAAAVPHLTVDALILLSGGENPAVAALLPGLAATGWRVGVYDTARGLAAAWRGAAVPVRHTADPAVDWSRPDYLAAFPPPRISGI